MPVAPIFVQQWGNVIAVRFWVQPIVTTKIQKMTLAQKF
jgi:hypothetical protein